MAEGNTALGEVIRRELERNLVAGEDANVVLAHLAVGVGDELVTVFKLDTIAGVGRTSSTWPDISIRSSFAINPVEHGRITKRSAGRAGVGW